MSSVYKHAPAPPITYTRTARNRYTCISGTTGQVYYLTIGDDNRATCTCPGWAHYQRCKHSKGLETTQLYEPLTGHAVYVRDDEPGVNFLVTCSCGYAAHVASLNRGYADAVGREHLEAQLPRAVQWPSR